MWEPSKLDACDYCCDYCLKSSKGGLPHIRVAWRHQADTATIDTNRRCTAICNFYTMSLLYQRRPPPVKITFKKSCVAVLLYWFSKKMNYLFDKQKVMMLALCLPISLLSERLNETVHECPLHNKAFVEHLGSNLKGLSSMYTLFLKLNLIDPPVKHQKIKLSLFK